MMRISAVIVSRPNRGVGEREQHDVQSVRYVVEGSDELLSLKQVYAHATRCKQKIEFIEKSNTETP